MLLFSRVHRPEADRAGRAPRERGRAGGVAFSKKLAPGRSRGRGPARGQVGERVPLRAVFLYEERAQARPLRSAGAGKRRETARGPAALFDPHECQGPLFVKIDLGPASVLHSLLEDRELPTILLFLNVLADRDSVKN